ncbi:MAG: hypothetical protein A2283_10190 [Lentisphaerae bacterium RIFOXYA12_FULL_48_11]|nr:MAG: hypothetical protein A2283_10190 [Lentisphaerae bacterium RIFOXYA12_FULL_48_11]
MIDSRKAQRTSIDVLQIALRKEEASCRLYEGMLNDSKVSFVRELLEKLRDEEVRHVRMIRKKIVQLEAGRG